jgi:dTDP-4-dehydrorhamnose 3,5-epimerase
MLKITRTEIPDVVILEPEIFGDARGYFFESFQGHRTQRFVIWQWQSLLGFNPPR